MDDVTTDAARAAARTLAGEFGDGLPGAVETILHAHDNARAPDQYLDPISLAGLIVSVASFAWTAYRDLKTKTDDPARDVIERRVRLHVRDSQSSAPPAQRDRVIEVVVSDIMDSTRPQRDTPDEEQQQ